METLETAEECGSCTRPVGPGVAALSDQLGAPRRAVCLACLDGLHPELAARLASSAAALLEEDSDVRTIAALLEVVASEYREALAPQLGYFSRSLVAARCVEKLATACNATPETFAAVLIQAADDLDELERWPPENTQRVLLDPNIDALYALTRMRSERMRAERQLVNDRRGRAP